MKKISMLLVAMMLVVAFTGTAMAAFTNGDLIQVVYQRGGSVEVATDLGAFSSTTAFGGTTITFNTTNFPTAGTGVFAGASQSDLYVAYYVAGGTGPIWVSGSNVAGQTSGSRQGSSAQALSTINNNYSVAAAGSSQVTMSQSNMNSYYSLMDKGGSSFGGFSNFIPLKDGEVGLGTTAYVDTYLYYYATPSATGAKAGVQVATIRTYADGTTQILGSDPVATPIPAAFMLFGSGLLGLVGMRRKQSV